MKRALLAAVAGLMLAAPSAQAAQLEVTTTADAPGVCVDGLCPTLRAALETAAGTAETDTIRLPAGDYVLLSDLPVPAGVTITGANARTTTVRGAALSVAGEASVEHVSIAGGLTNDGALTLDHVHASGIVNHTSLTLTRGLVDGGGIANTGTLTVSDSTIAFNPGGGIVGAGTGTLTRVTLVQNGATSVGGALHVRASLLDRCGPDLVSEGDNLLPLTCGSTPAAGDLFGQDAKLGAALVNAGGETDVLRIAPGSAAAGLARACIGADQRDLPRPQGPDCDAGAYEIEVVDVTGPSGPTRFDDAVFSFTAAPGSTFRCKLDGDEGPCTSPAEYPGLADGEHTFTVQAFAGPEAVSDPVTRTFTVDTVAPDVRITSGPPALGRVNDVSFAFSAEEDSAFACRLDGGDFAECESAQPYEDVPDGSHTFTVRASDAAGNVSERSRGFAIDTQAPAAPGVSGGADGFTLSAEAGAALACSLDGGAFAACASGVSYPGLAPGEHVLTVRATDAAGNASTTEHRFTIAHTPGAAIPPPVATPAYRKTVVLRPQAGRTLIRRPGETAFSEIRSRTAVAVGTVVNVKQGAVIVIAATRTATETAKFSGGIFTARGTDLALSERLRCGRARRLTGDGAGAFRIAGRFAKATGRGAKWTVEDTCRRTKIRVTRGVVAVVDKRRPKTVLIRSGRSYTARPKR